MFKKKKTVIERLLLHFWNFFYDSRMSFLAGITAGLAAHMFAFSNKLVNADDVVSIFEKGASVDSGRWGIELTWRIFSKVSAPWLHGTISMLLIVIASCLIVRLFSIENKLLKMLIPAVFISFPAVTGTYCYMFTSSAYGLAFLLAVLCVCFFVGEIGCDKKLRFPLACLSLVFSLGIFQAYIACAASFLVLMMIQRLFDSKHSTREVFMFGVRGLLMLGASLVLYYGITIVSVKLSGGALLSYALNTENSILFRVALAYSSFFKTFTHGYFGFVNSPMSVAVHIVTLVFCTAVVIVWMHRGRDLGRAALMLLCMGLLPLSIYCIYLIAHVGVIYTLVLYGFTSVYVLAAIIFDYAMKEEENFVFRACREVVVAAMLLVLINNVYFSNKVYFKMHLQYENAYAYFTGLVTQIRMDEEYDEGLIVAIIGDEDTYYDPEELELGHFLGTSNMINCYTRDYFIQRYVGFDAVYADGWQKSSLIADKRFEDMPVYPYNGSICRIDEYIVVKLG